jgi:hypothetical protein
MRLAERVEAMTDKQRNNSENLKPWKKGQSGNPAGRPKKADSLTSLLKDEMERIDPSDAEGRTWNERIVLATLRLAEQGVPAALKEVWERIEGKVRQDIGVDVEVNAEMHRTIVAARQRLARAMHPLEARNGESPGSGGTTL